ncbi:delta C isoform X1, partial [Brachionus plicatilis]
MKLLAVVLLLHLSHRTTLAYTIKSCKYDAYDSADPADNFKCYNGGLCYRLEHTNSTGALKICTCKPGFTGKHCEQSTLTPCSPDPCSPNGYCNAQAGAIGY